MLATWGLGGISFGLRYRPARLAQRTRGRRVGPLRRVATACRSFWMGRITAAGEGELAYAVAGEGRLACFRLPLGWGRRYGRGFWRAVVSFTLLHDRRCNNREENRHSLRLAPLLHTPLLHAADHHTYCMYLRPLSKGLGDCANHRQPVPRLFKRSIANHNNLMLNTRQRPRHLGHAEVGGGGWPSLSKKRAGVDGFYCLLMRMRRKRHVVVVWKGCGVMLGCLEPLVLLLRLCF